MTKNMKSMLWAIGSVILTTFGQEMSAGRVPIPAEWRWVIPMLVAVCVVASPYFKIGADDPSPHG